MAKSKTAPLESKLDKRKQTRMIFRVLLMLSQGKKIITALQVAKVPRKGEYIFNLKTPIILSGGISVPEDWAAGEFNGILLTFSYEELLGTPRVIQKDILHVLENFSNRTGIPFYKKFKISDEPIAFNRQRKFKKVKTKKCRVKLKRTILG